MRFNPEIKDEAVEVILPAFVCEGCEEPLMNAEQMNQLRKAAADAYRQKHNLLTSTEIVGMRERLGMSQSEFARYLKVGEASIKRWETYFVQDEGQDDHIRLKSDEAAAEFNSLDMHWKKSPADELSGNRRFNCEIFKNTLLALLKHCKSPLFLNKALFYVDFLHFKRHGASLTGSRYVRLEYGPCPDQFQSIYNFLRSKKIVKPQGKHNLVSVVDANFEVFDDKEKETIEFIVKKVKNDGGKKLYELSHLEDGFEKTPYLGLISYNNSRTLKLS
jgi:putative zinc finger/helix-turn-helix YgiT family protein